MEQVDFAHTIADAVSSFHVAHIRSLLNQRKHRGGATNHVPENARRTYLDRVAGHVMVILPEGRMSWAAVFEALTPEEVPSARVAHGVLDGVTYWFRCSPLRARVIGQRNLPVDGPCINPHAAGIDIGAQFHVIAVGPEWPRRPRPLLRH